MKFIARVAVWATAMIAGGLLIYSFLAPSPTVLQTLKKKKTTLGDPRDPAALLQPLIARNNVVLMDGVPMMAGMAEEYLEVKRKRALERRRPANATEIRKALDVLHQSLSKTSSLPRVQQQPKKVIIVSTWRSGSTFLGQVLASHPGVFYHYEPFSYLGVKRIRDEDSSALRVIDDLFRCGFDRHKEYMNYTRTFPEDMLGHNVHVWSACRDSGAVNVCWNETFLTQACRKFPVQVMKLVRVGLHMMEEVLSRRQTEAKIIFLARDPRAIYHSRVSSVHWCRKSQDCFDPRRFCVDLSADLLASESIQRTFPGKLLRVRYEDLVRDSSGAMKSLFQFLGLSYTPAIQALVYNLTHTNEDAPWSVRRNASERVDLWKTKLGEDRLRRVQMLCKKSLEMLDYPLIDL